MGVVDVRWCLGPKESLLKLQVVLEPSDDGGFTVYVPVLPGCISEGYTRDEAIANIKAAIALYLEPMEDNAVLSSSAETLEIEL